MAAYNGDSNICNGARRRPKIEFPPRPFTSVNHDNPQASSPLYTGGLRPLHPGAPPAQAPAKPTIEELEKLYRARATLPKGRPSQEWQERRKQIDAELLANLGKK